LLLAHSFCLYGAAERQCSAAGVPAAPAAARCTGNARCAAAGSDAPPTLPPVPLLPPGAAHTATAHATAACCHIFAGCAVLVVKVDFVVSAARADSTERRRARR
jgi:hypothetical protein